MEGFEVLIEFCGENDQKPVVLIIRAASRGRGN
jgi:hypothetical protein